MFATMQRRDRHGGNTRGQIRESPIQATPAAAPPQKEEELDRTSTTVIDHAMRTHPDAWIPFQTLTILPHIDCEMAPAYRLQHGTENHSSYSPYTKMRERPRQTNKCRRKHLPERPKLTVRVVVCF